MPERLSGGYAAEVASRLLGRDEELGRLVGLAGSVARRLQPAAAFLHGEPGSGKTRLLREVDTRLEVDHRFWVVGYQPESGVALAAAGELLAGLDRLAGTGSVLTLSGSLDLTPVGLFEAAHQALVGAGGVTVLFIDDVQWIDDTSLALLHYLARAAFSAHQPLVVVAAARETPRAWGFAQALHRLAGEDFAAVRLDPLGREAGELLARDIDPTLSVAAAADLWRRAQGSPFWIEVLAASGIGEVDLAAFVSGPIRALGADPAALMRTLAVVGRPVVERELAAMMGWSKTRIHQAVEQATTAGLATEVDGVVSVVHDLVRAALIEHAAPDRLRRVHGRLARWYEAEGKGDIRMAAAALGHRIEAGLPVTESALAISRSPQRRLVGSKGVRLLAAIAGRADHSRPAAAELNRQVARLAGELGEHEIEFGLEAELVELEADPTDIADAALRAASALLELERLDEARTYLERARASPTDDPLVAIGLAAQGANLARWEGAVESVRPLAAAALEGSRQLGAAAEPRARGARVAALLAAADVAVFVDDPVTMLELNDELAHFAAGFDERVHIRALAEGALALRLLGRTGDAEPRARRAWDQARRAVFPQATLESGAILGTMLWSLGRLGEARQIWTELQGLGMRLAELVPAQGLMTVLPHMIELEAGDWRAAAATLGDAAAASDLAHYSLHGHMERAAALARLDPDGAARDAADAVEASVVDAERAGCLRCRAETGIRGAEALARVGDRKGGRALLKGTPPPHPDSALLQWWLRRARCFLELAPLEQLASLADEAEAQGLVIEALRTRLDFARSLLEQDRGRASEELWRVGSAAEPIGAITIQRAAEQALRSIGVRTWRRGSDRPTAVLAGSLTAREWEVARLAAAGASNPEIAASLFLSRKTVERHLSNILAKLGARNRTELAALVATEGASRE